MKQKLHSLIIKNELFRYMEEKGITMIALWCPMFSNHG